MVVSEIPEIAVVPEILELAAVPEIPEIAAVPEIPEIAEITVPEIPEIPTEPLDPKTLSEELERIIEEIEEGEIPEADGDNHTIIKPLLPDNAELNTPEFSPISYESFDVTRDISDWEDLDDDIIETMDTSESYI